MKKTVDYTEKQCAICGKTFVVAVDWAYKAFPKKNRAPIYFCSWKHTRQYETENSGKRTMRLSAAHC